MARGLSTARNTPGLRSRRLKEIRIAADKRQAVLLRELAAAGQQHGIEVAPPASLKRMVSGWENGAPMSADYRRLFCIVYDLSETELGFTANDTRPPAPLGADLDPWELADALTSSTITAPTLAEMERAVLGYAHRYGTTPPTELWPQVSRQMTRMKDAISQPQPLPYADNPSRCSASSPASPGSSRWTYTGPTAPTACSPSADSPPPKPTTTTWPRGSPPPRASARSSPSATPPPPSCSPTPNASPASASSARRRAWIAAMHARALAAAGQHRQALAALDRAHAHITKALDEPRGTDFFDAPRLDGITGSVYLLLREPAQAADFIGRALDHRSRADHKGRALLTLDLAACRVIEHQDDEAGQLINTALDIAAGSLVRPIINRAHDVRAHMALWTNTPAAADLDARLADLAS